MLTARENLLECIKPDGKPDRFVNQYEYIKLLMNASVLHRKRPKMGEPDCKNAWGVMYSWPQGVPAARKEKVKRRTRRRRQEWTSTS